MPKIDWAYWRFMLLLVVIFAVIGVQAGAWVRAFASCDGHVLKNALDWPVCIK